MTDADDDGWVSVAMADTTVVVELLMQLLQNPKRPSKTSAAVDLPHNWKVRQRRSKGSPSSSTPTTEKDKAMESTRESPTTPLSWSGGGGSVSGGFAEEEEEEESCKPPLKQPTTSTTRATRSKINTSETTSSKRSKKKKTLPVLREEEKMLIKEQKKLKHELISLRATVEKERTTNESLKRIKTAKGTAAASCTSDETMSDQDQNLESLGEPRHKNSPPCLDCNDSNWYFQLQKTSSDRKSSSLLPDLNLPLEELSPEGLHTAS